MSSTQRNIGMSQVISPAFESEVHSTWDLDELLDMTVVYLGILAIDQQLQNHVYAMPWTGRAGVMIGTCGSASAG